jgi:hypothetical protein
MRFVHADDPARRLLLGYCLNLHPARDLDEFLRRTGAVAAPLRERLGVRGRFGVGPWMGAALVDELLRSPAALRRLVEFLRDERLEPFTWNAFPYGEFHSAGVKESVFEPRWSDPARATYTRQVAQLALELAELLEPDAPASRAHGDERSVDPRFADPRFAESRAHVSISTHTGGHSTRWSDPDEAAASGLLDSTARALAKLSLAHGRRARLGLEPEPRANLSSQGDLRAFWDRARAELRARPDSVAWLAAWTTHMGACLDLCHSAVEFEDDPLERLGSSAHGGVPIVKVQVTNALRLEAPARHPRAVEALLALDEPRWLHQTNALVHDGVLRAGDLPEVRAALSGPERERWLGAAEWRTHFHVPVDLAAAEGLSTTFALTRRTLDRLLSTPAAEDLHLEIETYTWSALGGALAGGTGAASGDDALVAGLEREYRALLPILEGHGWRRADS